jgi:lipid-binding SYLF domain-containing protein
MRSGLWMSGSGGSGILIARKADGTWSPPSGIILHTAALGFALGVDIYDCVLVINSVAALEVFTRPRTTLGADVNLTVGPLVTTGLLENDVRWKQLEGSVLTYLKARGQHQHVPLDGSLVTERTNENERFYGSNVNVLDVLAGNIHKSIPETRPIFEVIKAAEGRTDFDAALMEALSRQPAPGDAIIDSPKDKVAPLSPPRSPFGVPNLADPDPFGVIALEMAGMEIREAGSRLRPASSQFEFHPAPSSPLFSNFNRQSIDTYQSRNNRSNRGSVMSSKSQGTQTDIVTPETALSRNTSDDGQHDAVFDKLPTVVEPEEIDYTQVDISAILHLQRQASIPEPQPEPEPVKVEVSSPQSKPSTVHHGSETDVEKRSTNSPTEDEDDERDADADDEDDEDDYVSAGEEDETIVYEIATATAPARAPNMSTQVTQVIQAKGALVTIPKRIPPPLPARSPARTSRVSKSEFGDVSSLRSPLRTSFQSSDVHSLRTPTPSAEESTNTATAETPVANEDVKEATNGFLVPEAPFTPGHRKQASSVYPTDEEESATENKKPPPVEQTVEMTPSAEELEQEPQTSPLEDDVKSQTANQHERQLSKDETQVLPQTDIPTIALAQS